MITFPCAQAIKQEPAKRWCRSSLRRGETETGHNRAKGAAAMKAYIFRVVVEEDALRSGQRAYHASCPALKGCHTWGHTYAEALANIREAVELYIEDLREAGETIPVDSGQGAVEWPTPAVAVNV